MGETNTRRNIVGIQIACENFETLPFALGDFSYINIAGVQKSYEKHFSSKDISIYRYATEGAELHIKKEADRMGEADWMYDLGDGRTLFERLQQWMNITWLYLVYDNRETKGILMPYEYITPNTPEESKLQTVAKKKDGTLCIRIWKEGTEDSVKQAWISEIENEEIY